MTTDISYMPPEAQKDYIKGIEAWQKDKRLPIGASFELEGGYLTAKWDYMDYGSSGKYQSPAVLKELKAQLPQPKKTFVEAPRIERKPGELTTMQAIRVRGAEDAVLGLDQRSPIGIDLDALVKSDPRCGYWSSKGQQAKVKAEYVRAAVAFQSSASQKPRITIEAFTLGAGKESKVLLRVEPAEGVQATPHQMAQLAWRVASITGRTTMTSLDDHSAATFHPGKRSQEFRPGHYRH